MKLTLLFLAALLIGCSDDPQIERLKMAIDNPFNTALNEPIDYANVTSGHIKSYVDISIANAVIDLGNIKTTDDQNFENTFGAYDRISNNLNKAGNNAFLLNWVSTDSTTRAEGTKGYQKIDSLNTEIGSDKALYKVFQSYANSEEGKAITGNKKTLINKVLEDFERSGVSLNDKDLEKYKTLSAEISELSAQFSANINSAEEVLVFNEQEVDGLPENFKDKYRLDSGGYEIPVINATSGTVMSNAKSSAVRKAFTIKKQNIAADKNLVILDSLISKRYQLGKLMGYESYAGYNLQSKMAKNPTRVWDFIN